MSQLPVRSTIDARVRAAWQEQVAAVRNTPGLASALLQQRQELLPRFAACYTQLRALPRRARRALQRKWKLSLAGVALLLALGQEPVLAATINVSGGCSLINAITAANTDTATGGCPQGSGADTITLPAGTDGIDSVWLICGRRRVRADPVEAGAGRSRVRGPQGR